MQFRIVLRDSATGKYYRGPGLWVSNAYDGLTFANIIDAEEFCRAEGLEQLQIIQRSGYFFRAPRFAALNKPALDQTRPSAQS